MSRRRGITVEILDFTALENACLEAGLSRPGYGNNALLRQESTGRMVVLSNEGVGSTTYGEGVVYLDTDALEWQCLPIEKVLAARTGETMDLADFIRTFGTRLDVNHLEWYEWAQQPA